MIPIKPKENTAAYTTFVTAFKSMLENIHKRGYVNDKRVRKSKDDILTEFKSLEETIKPLFLRAIEDGFDLIADIEASEKKYLMAPDKMMCEDARSFLKCLIKDLNNADNFITSTDLTGSISRFQKYLPLNAEGKVDTKSVVYETISKIFIKKGYEKKNFKDIVWKVTDLRVCPYCNRTYIPYIRSNSKNCSIRGQLDHFYPKETYPYLAVSLYNLVPSCTYCNGTSCKGTKDPSKEGIVNPFLLKSHTGLRFRIDKFDENIVNLDKCEESIKIAVDTTTDPKMANNERVFRLLEIYSFHKDIAAEIIFKFKKYINNPYLKFADGITSKIGQPLAINHFHRLYWGVPLEVDRLRDRPMSKFTLDLIHNLDEIYHLPPDSCV